VQQHPFQYDVGGNNHDPRANAFALRLAKGLGDRNRDPAFRGQEQASYIRQCWRRLDRSFITGRLHHHGGITYFLIALAAIILLIWMSRRGEEKPRALAMQIAKNSWYSAVIRQRESMVRNYFKVNLRPQHFIFGLAVCTLVLMVVYGFLLITTGGRVSPGGSLRSREASKVEQILMVAPPKLPPCPTAGASTLQPSPATGHHKVTLSWNASSPSTDPEKKAVGYCLYRSTTQSAAKQKPTCPDCEQINNIPIVGTGCVDDLVKDGANYYYVVTAINTGGRISPASNETPAQIPTTKEANGLVAVGSYPLCRATTGTQ